MLKGLYSRSSAEHVMAMFSSCEDAIAVAKACDLQSNWQTFMLSLYRQVIQNHNLKYIQTLHASSVASLPAQAFEQLSERFKSDSGRAHHIHAFKETMFIFLENGPDPAVRIRLLGTCPNFDFSSKMRRYGSRNIF